jgi:hypothetical protein
MGLAIPEDFRNPLLKTAGVSFITLLVAFAAIGESDASTGETKYTGPAVSRAKAKHRYQEGHPDNLSGNKYKSHLDGQKKLSFDTKATQDSYTSTHPSYETQSGKILTSSNIQPSHLSRKGEIGNNSSRMEYQKALLDSSEFDFLEKLASHIPDENAAKRIDRIIEGQRHQERLSRQDYNYLAELSREIDDPQISYNIYQIAEKRRKLSYE